MRVLIYGVSGYALYLTTSRTSLLSFAFMIAADLAIFLLRWGAGLRPGQATRIVFWVLAASPFVLPIASVIIFNNIDLRSVPTALYSYQDRATVTWVLPFQVLQEYFFPQGYFLGVGVGMAGYPMNFSDLSFLFVSYFDNFPLGTYLMFGVPGLIFLIQLILRTGVRCTSRSSLILCGLLLFYGTTIEGYGDATFCMILGGLISPNNRWNSSWA